VQGNQYQIPLAKFKQDFAQSRKLNSKALLISSTQYRNVFIVQNPENRNKYPVRYISSGIECKCRDFEKQQEILGKGCCKHGYKLLNHLGYNSLQSYLDRNNSVAEI
ncbi:MAG: SWIM zinc finger family protein, partial [Waterburya sp.]